MAKKIQKIGIFFDIGEIAISLCSVFGSTFKVEKEISIPTNFQLKEKVVKPISFNSEFFNEKQEWVAKFKEALKKNSISADAVVTLSHNFSITRFFTMPYIDRKFWSKSVPIESRKYIPVAFEEMSYDFYAYPVMNNTKVAVLFGITQRKTVEFLLEIFKSLSINMVYMESSAISFERIMAVVDQEEHEKKVYLHFSGGNYNAIFSYNGCPVIFREMSIESPSSMSERKNLDLKGSIAFVKRYVPQQDYSKVVLSGENVALWQKLAESESGLKTEILDFSKISNVKKSSFSLIASYGASLFDSIKSVKSVDISGMSSGKKIEKKIQAYTIGAVGSISCVFLMLGLLNTVRTMNISAQINAYVAKMTESSEFTGMTSEMIREKVDSLKNQNRIIQSLFLDKDFLAPKMSAIADTIPSPLWIRELTYVSQIGTSEMSEQGKMLEIKGETSLKGEAKLNTIDLFVKRLKDAPEFRIFTGESGNVDKTVDSSSEKKTFGFSGTQDFFNDVSAFTITCTQKKV